MRRTCLHSITNTEENKSCEFHPAIKKTNYLRMKTIVKLSIAMSLLFPTESIFGKTLKNQFKKEAKCVLSKTTLTNESHICGDDTDHLPDIVRKYLYRTEIVGKPSIQNMKIIFEGKIRKQPNDPWMKLTAYQISSFNHPTRLFYMKASKMGIPVWGFHCFKNGKASMKVKILGLFSVVDAQGKLMDQSETVTHFNDMCLMAPGTLIDKNIQWEEMDSLTVKAFYTMNGVTISAILQFNNDGFLENFISNDRYDLSDQGKPKLYPFSTPIKYYMESGNLLLPQTAKTIYTLPEGDFEYGEFTIKSIEYNTTNIKFYKKN